MKKHWTKVLIAVFAAVFSLAIAAACGPEETPPVTEYTVTYVGGTGAQGTAPASEKHAAGEKFNVAANTFTLEGKTFTAWNDGEKNVEAGAEYTMPDRDVTFTAQWQDNGSSGPQGPQGPAGPTAQTHAEKIDGYWLAEDVTVAESHVDSAILAVECYDEPKEENSLLVVGEGVVWMEFDGEFHISNGFIVYLESADLYRLAVSLNDDGERSAFRYHDGIELILGTKGESIPLQKAATPSLDLEDGEYYGRSDWSRPFSHFTVEEGKVAFEGEDPLDMEILGDFARLSETVEGKKVLRGAIRTDGKVYYGAPDFGASNQSFVAERRDVAPETVTVTVIEGFVSPADARTKQYYFEKGKTIAEFDELFRASLVHSYRTFGGWKSEGFDGPAFPTDTPITAETTVYLYTPPRVPTFVYDDNGLTLKAGQTTPSHPLTIEDYDGNGFRYTIERENPYEVGAGMDVWWELVLTDMDDPSEVRSMTVLNRSAGGMIGIGLNAVVKAFPVYIGGGVVNFQKENGFPLRNVAVPLNGKVAESDFPEVDLEAWGSDPAKYEFKYWYYTSENEEKIPFGEDTAVTRAVLKGGEAVTVKPYIVKIGTVEPVKYTLIYDLGEYEGEDFLMPERVAASAEIELKEPPEWTGHTFVGWKIGGDVLLAGTRYAVNGNVTATAQWREAGAEPTHAEKVGGYWSADGTQHLDGVPYEYEGTKGTTPCDYTLEGGLFVEPLEAGASAPSSPLPFEAEAVGEFAMWFGVVSRIYPEFPALDARPLEEGLSDAYGIAHGILYYVSDSSAIGGVFDGYYMLFGDVGEDESPSQVMFLEYREGKIGVVVGVSIMRMPTKEQMDTAPRYFLKPAQTPATPDFSGNYYGRTSMSYPYLSITVNGENSTVNGEPATVESFADMLVVSSEKLSPIVLRGGEDGKYTAVVRYPFSLSEGKTEYMDGVIAFSKGQTPTVHSVKLGWYEQINEGMDGRGKLYTVTYWVDDGALLPRADDPEYHLNGRVLGYAGAYEIVGWQEMGGAEYGLTTPVTRDLELVAVLAPYMPKVRFEANGLALADGKSAPALELTREANFGSKFSVPDAVYFTTPENPYELGDGESLVWSISAEINGVRFDPYNPQSAAAFTCVPAGEACYYAVFDNWVFNDFLTAADTFTLVFEAKVAGRDGWLLTFDYGEKAETTGFGHQSYSGGDEKIVYAKYPRYEYRFVENGESSVEIWTPEDYLGKGQWERYEWVYDDGGVTKQFSEFPYNRNCTMTLRLLGTSPA